MRILIFFTLFFISINCIYAQTADRSDDPVVFKGIDLPCLLNTSFANKVAFKYDNAWIQVPIQFDEMALMNVNAPYGPFIGQGNIPDQNGYDVLFYTDANTYVGAAPNPNFDEDDELAFMYRDAGSQVSVNAGSNVILKAGQEICLESNFEVILGAEFEAVIEGCQ